MPVALARRALSASGSGLLGIRRVHDRTPLRVRLVAVLLLLVIVALAISGVLARTILRHNLIDRVDAQLKSVAQPTQEHGVTASDAHGGHIQRESLSQGLAAAKKLVGPGAAVLVEDAPAAIIAGQPPPNPPRREVRRRLFGRRQR